MRSRFANWRYILIAGIVFTGALFVFINYDSFGLKQTSPHTTERLRVGVVQMNIRPTIEKSRDFIVDQISRVARRNARVVVFPERALSGTGADDVEKVREAIDAIKKAASEGNVYAIFGAFIYSNALDECANSMFVIGPDGKERFHYDKLYNNHQAPMPDAFFIDGIACSGIICADRWLRGIEEIPVQKGARISFELANNFGVEWIEPLQWYWYVPRALRNNVWVVFANSAKTNFTWPYTPAYPFGHGHSAIISPEGVLADNAAGDEETVVMADIDVSEATRSEALARSGHPALQPFWQAGVKLQSGELIDSTSFTPFQSSKAEVTIGVAQVSGSLALIEHMVKKAKDRRADLVVFPARAVSAESELNRLKAMARKYAITIVIGKEHQLPDGLRNSAFVFGPDGALLTRYDQLSATGKYRQADDPGAMWFRVKGVPAVVTIGRDALWSEIAELAAVAGARIHVHLDDSPIPTKRDRLKLLQVWANMASFRTFTAVANIQGSTLWEDLHTRDEIHAVLEGKPRPDNGTVEIFSPWSANLITEAKGDSLILATRQIPGNNNYHPRSTSNFNPQMAEWYRIGGKIIQSKAGARMNTYLK